MADPRVPISFIVDDPPINATYWLRRQPEEMGFAEEPRGDFGKFVHRWRDQEASKIIPNAFWTKLIRWAKQAGVKGKFTVLPCPAGLGCLDDRVEGYSAAELSEWIGLVREEYAPRFDLTPEIMTHSMAWDIRRRCLLPVAEHVWMSRQTEEVFTAYLAEALHILTNVGLHPTGITQPCSFSGDRALYARAVLAAMKQVCGLKRTFLFLDCDGESNPVNSPLLLADPANGDYVVSVTSAIRGDEPFWASLYGDGDVERMADYFISPDGRTGRFVDLLRTGSPIIFHAHGQTLFSNGTEKGFRSLQVVIERVDKYLGHRVRWVKIGEFVEERIHSLAAGK